MVRVVMSSNPNPNPQNPDTIPPKQPGREQPAQPRDPAQPGRQQPPRPGDPVPLPPDQPDIAPPAEPVRKPPQMLAPATKRGMVKSRYAAYREIRCPSPTPFGVLRKWARSWS